MYALCMMLCIILDNTIHRGRTKMEIIKGIKTKVQLFYCILCNVCLHLKSMQLVNISVQKSSVGFPFNQAICVSIQILYMTV